MTQLFVEGKLTWDFYGVTGSTVTELLGLSIPPFLVNGTIDVQLNPNEEDFSTLVGPQVVGGISGNSLFINISNISSGTVSGTVTSTVPNYIELNLIDSEPIKFTKRSSVLEDPAQVASNYTNTFIVPHTTINGEFFKAAFNINSTSFDATKKIPSYINIDGVQFTTGDLRLNSVIRNDKTGKIEYEVIFIGEIGSFAGVIGSKLMNELDLTEYNHQLTQINIKNSWNKQLFNGDILYPLIEWGYTYRDENGATVPEQNTVSKYRSALQYSPATRGFTITGNPLLQGQFKPIIRVKALFDRIFKEAGFTYESNFINNYNYMIMDMYHISTGPNTSGPLLPAGDLIARYNPASTPTDIALKQRVKDYYGWNYDFIMPNKNVSTIFDPYYTINTTNRDVYLPFTTPPPAFVPKYYGTYDISYFKIPNTGQYRITIDPLKLYTSKSLSDAQKVQNINIYIYKNGVAIDSQTGTFNSLTSNNPGNYFVYKSPGVTNFDFPSATTYYTFDKDDEIEIRLQRDEYSSGYTILYVNDASVYSLYTPTPTFNFNSMFPSNYKQTDFIKSLNDKFKLIWEPDPQNPKNFFIEPWVDWVRVGRKLDWTNKLNENISIISKPTFQTQPRTLTFKDKPETDIYNYQFQQEYKKGFGEVKLYSDIEIIAGESTIETFISPIQLGPIGNSDSFLVPHLAKDSGDKIEPIEVTPRFCFYNGLIDNPIDPVTSLSFKWYMFTDVNTSEVQAYYPLVSNYYKPKNLGILNQPYFDNYAFDISWGNVKQFWLPSSNSEYGNGVTYQTAFNNYWGIWYEDVYSSYSRIIEAAFSLNISDIKDLRFNDRVWIKDAWYFPLTVKDYVVNDRQNVKVELLKVGSINIQDGNLTKYTLCYDKFLSCNSCCCYDTIDIYSTTNNLNSEPDLYLDKNGIYKAPSGYYNNVGSSLAYYYGYLGPGGTASCVGCSCSIVLFPISVCTDTSANGVCCCTSPSTTLFFNNVTADTSTQIWADNLGTIPITPFTWVKEIGGDAIQVGADGHTVVQFNNCSGFIC